MRLILRYVAEVYKLNYVHVYWEKFDLVARRESLRKTLVRNFVDFSEIRIQ